MMLLILYLLLGMVLGQRFKVLVLVPATLVVLGLTIAGQIMHVNAIWPLPLAAVAAAASLQIGYLFGLGIRHVLMGIRTHRLETSTLTGTSSPPQRSVR